MKLKICGMKLNTKEVAELQPDYLGFIFWEPSSRFFDGGIPELPDSIQKVGIFVDASVEEILDKIEKYNLQAVQLHGSESPEFCGELRPQRFSSSIQDSADRLKPLGSSRRPFDIIKVFSIKDNFDFSVLEAFDKVCDYYLFDTKGKLPGGNGYTFDWSVLKNYPSNKPYFLSGGIGLKDIDAIKEFIIKPESKYCHAIDVNSRFEIEPGLKDLRKLNRFKKLFKVQIS